MMTGNSISEVLIKADANDETHLKFKVRLTSITQ